MYGLFVRGVKKCGRCKEAAVGGGSTVILPLVIAYEESKQSATFLTAKSGNPVMPDTGDILISVIVFCFVFHFAILFSTSSNFVIYFTQPVL